MWPLRRKQTVCPICNSVLSRIDGKNICKSCRIEIKGSSLKPLQDNFGGESTSQGLRG